jgi:cysteine-S-conjugate beta-lyase
MNPDQKGESLSHGVSSTELIHHDYKAPMGFESPQTPVYKASSVIFPSVSQMQTRNWEDRSAYTYGLHGTPTTFTLESKLALLEGGEQCLLLPSGLAALAAVNAALLSSGDEVLVPDNAYGPLLSMLLGQFKKWGIQSTRYNPLDSEDLSHKIKDNTRLVWLEAAGSVTLEFPDLLGLIRVCQDRGVTTALDNTWGAGLSFKPFELLHSSLSPTGVTGVDISVHALTKYPSGGADLLMGSVITRDKVLAKRLSKYHEQFGLGVGANDVESVLKGLQSLVLRYDAQDQAARALARFLQGEPSVAQVLHPALSGSPGHEHWREVTCTPLRPEGRAAGIFSVIFRLSNDLEAIHAFCERLKLFKLAYSWGGPMSLVMPYDLGSMRKGTMAHLEPGHLVRFCIGLESVEDLQADLARSLSGLSA